MGNHEFYKYYDVATLPDGYCLDIRRNVKSYYNGVVNIGDTDFHRILCNGEIMTFADFNREHSRCLQYICGCI